MASMEDTYPPYDAGERVQIERAEFPWTTPAVVVSGPHPALTSEHKMYLVRAEGDDLLVYPSQMRKVSA